MNILRALDRIGVDRFTMMLVATVCLATLLPARGVAAQALPTVTEIAIGVMFFLYGARLPRETVIKGLANWRMHALILVSTFVLFPLVAWAMVAAVPLHLPADVRTGILFLATLPSTVQSSIAFTSIARGNVAAAITSASASSLIGIVVTPLLTGIVLSAHGGVSAHQILAIALQLLFPFVAGQLLRPWIGAWAHRHEAVLKHTDRGSILLVVYGAFSEAVIGGIWHQLPAQDFAIVIVLNGVLLALILGATTGLSRLFGFAKEDEIAIVFCGSKKSLASGVPMASVLFAGHAIGVIVLPLMLFHQIQLMVCAILARRFAARPIDRAPAAVLPPDTARLRDDDGRRPRSAAAR